jgi:hypothetical protein
MEEKVIRQLNYVYYGMMFLALTALGVMYYLLMNGSIEPLDRLSRWGQIVQYIVIFDALVTIPGGLYGFKRLIAPVRTMEDKEQQALLYRKYAAIRILLVSNSMVLGIIAYYWLGAYPSMLWLAGIGAIAWYFTKPTVGKMQIELTPEMPEE